MEGRSSVPRRSPRHASLGTNSLFLHTPSFSSSSPFPSSLFPPMTPSLHGQGVGAGGGAVGGGGGSGGGGGGGESDFLSPSLFPPSTPSLDPFSPPLSALGAMGMLKAMNTSHQAVPLSGRRRSLRRNSALGDGFSLLAAAPSPLHFGLPSPALLPFSDAQSLPSASSSSSSQLTLESPQLSSVFPSTPSISSSPLPPPSFDGGRRGGRGGGRRSSTSTSSSAAALSSSFLTSPSPPFPLHSLPRRSPRFLPSSASPQSLQSPGLFPSPNFSFSLPSPSLSSLPSRLLKGGGEDSFVPPSPSIASLDASVSPSAPLRSPNRSILRSMNSGHQPSSQARKRRRPSVESSKLSAMFSQFTPPLQPLPSSASSASASSSSASSAASTSLYQANLPSRSSHPSHPLLSSSLPHLSPDSSHRSLSARVDEGRRVGGSGGGGGGARLSGSGRVDDSNGDGGSGNGLGSSCHQCKSRRSLSNLIFCCNLFVPSSSASKKAGLGGGTATTAAAVALAAANGAPAASSAPAPVVKSACRKKYCAACVPEKDTRVLTDSGFLFLKDIEQRLTLGEQVLYACYEVSTRGIVYCPGRLVYSAPPERWVEFTQADSRRLWDKAGAVTALSTDGAGAEGGQPNHLSLRTTPNHLMYVQPCDQDGAVAPPQIVPAEELTPAFVCACVKKALGCLHGASSFRFLAGAAQGVDGSQLARRNHSSTSAAATGPSQSADELSVFGQSKEQLRVLLRGLSRADQSLATAQGPIEGFITASSVVSRERALQLCIHAGYSAYFTQRTPTTWQVHYSEALASDLPSVDVRFDEEYDLKRDGRVWCVNVEHPDHLIFVQRAQCNGSGDVTEVGRCVVIGNCLSKFYQEQPPPLHLRQSPASTWQCPSCRGVCCCAACRRSKLKKAGLAGEDGGLPPLNGDVSSSSSHLNGLSPNSRPPVRQLHASDVPTMDVAQLLSYALVYLPHFAADVTGHPPTKKRAEGSKGEQKKQKTSAARKKERRLKKKLKKKRAKARKMRRKERSGREEDGGEGGTNGQQSDDDSEDDESPRGGQERRKRRSAAASSGDGSGSDSSGSPHSGSSDAADSASSDDSDDEGGTVEAMTSPLSAPPPAPRGEGSEASASSHSSAARRRREKGKKTKEVKVEEGRAASSPTKKRRKKEELAAGKERSKRRAAAAAAAAADGGGDGRGGKGVQGVSGASGSEKALHKGRGVKKEEGGEESSSSALDSSDMDDG